MKYTIYLHRNKINKKVYVGLTSKSAKKRWEGHCKKAEYYCKKNNGNYFQRAIIKYGKENWELNILETCDSLEEVEKAEKKWIKHYKSNNSNFGYNLTEGGNVSQSPIDGRVREKISKSISELWSNGVYKENSKKIKQWHQENDNPFLGKKHSGESLKMMSKKCKRWHQENDNPFLGKKHSEATKKIMSEAASNRLSDSNNHPMSGKKHSEKSKEKMRGPRECFSKISKQKLLAASLRFKRQVEIAKHFNCTPANICYLIKRYNIREKFKKNLTL